MKQRYGFKLDTERLGLEKLPIETPKNVQNAPFYEVRSDSLGLISENNEVR